MGTTKGVFYVDKEMMSIDISEETENKVHLEACERDCLMSDVYKEAYLRAQQRRAQFTENFLLQYIGNPGPCERDSVQQSGWGNMTSIDGGK